MSEGALLTVRGVSVTLAGRLVLSDVDGVLTDGTLTFLADGSETKSFHIRDGLGIVLAIWSAPTMTLGHLLFAALLTAYLLIGIRHEERDLVRAFGDVYRRYQAEVPMLLPLPFASKLIGWRRRSASS